MGIAFRDFVPAATSTGLLSRSVESITKVTERANAWIGRDAIDVLNVETVMIPGGHGTSEDGDHTQSTDMMTTWTYVVRVWYRAAT